MLLLLTCLFGINKRFLWFVVDMGLPAPVRIHFARIVALYL